MDRLDILCRAFGDYQKFGSEYMFKCPNGCHETKNKLSVNIEKNAYKCWKCEDIRGSDIRFLILKYAKQYIKDWSALGPVDKTYVDDCDFGDVEPNWHFSDWQKWNRFLYKEWDSQSEAVKEYINKKKITKNKSLIWNIRTSSVEADTLLIPSFGLDGNVNYFSKRKLIGDNKFFKPRAKFDIFNEFWLDFGKPIFLVENAFDAVRFLPSEAMPILGSYFGKYNTFIERCINSETVVNVFLDVDAGDKEQKIYENLVGFGIVANRINNIFEKDIDELEDWQLEICKTSFVNSKDVFTNYIKGKLL